MDTITDLAEKLWTGEISILEHNPLVPLDRLEELRPGVAFVSSFGNVTAVDTADGLVLVDTGSVLSAARVHEQVRAWSPKRLHTAVYTHGHIDHVFGMPPFDEEARTKGWPRPHVVAHAALPARFERYKLTSGYNGCINQRQFRMPGLAWPTDYRYPDEVYEGTRALDVGGVRVELVHGRGETDDHTWVYLPEARVLCTGDFFIWASPNAGNPQKVQRYPLEWARALRAMATVGAEVLCPGHGVPILGAQRIRQALLETAELLELLHDETLALMNAGAPLDDILHTVRAPERLLERPYLRPVYDEPEFVIRNVWRLYGGWWDGDPSHLKPAPEAAVAGELADLAGGAGRLAARAEQLAERGDLALACHLAELAGRAAPDDPGVRAVRAAVYRRRAKAETSLMSRSIYRWAGER
jgi:alkyl sulfatase BDS1-like metallo-beta-lactamase superfamily hydrolase